MEDTWLALLQCKFRTYFNRGVVQTLIPFLFVPFLKPSIMRMNYVRTRMSWKSTRDLSTYAYL